MSQEVVAIQSLRARIVEETDHLLQAHETECIQFGEVYPPRRDLWKPRTALEIEVIGLSGGGKTSITRAFAEKSPGRIQYFPPPSSIGNRLISRVDICEIYLRRFPGISLARVADLIDSHLIWSYLRHTNPTGVILTPGRPPIKGEVSWGIRRKWEKFSHPFNERAQQLEPYQRAELKQIMDEHRTAFCDTVGITRDMDIYQIVLRVQDYFGIDHKTITIEDQDFLRNICNLMIPITRVIFERLLDDARFFYQLPPDSDPLREADRYIRMVIEQNRATFLVNQGLNRIGIFDENDLSALTYFRALTARGFISAGDELAARASIDELVDSHKQLALSGRLRKAVVLFLLDPNVAFSRKKKISAILNPETLEFIHNQQLAVFLSLANSPDNPFALLAINAMQTPDKVAEDFESGIERILTLAGESSLV